MDRKNDKTHNLKSALELKERRTFLATGFLTLASLVLGPLFRGSTLAAVTHRYKLAPESVLPADIRRAPVDVREAYRFAVANRDILRYIPCYSAAALLATRATPRVTSRTLPRRI